MEADAELFSGIMTEVLFDESRSETIKASGHGCMGGKKISRACGGQGHVKRLRVLLHETVGAFQYRKGRMTFVQVTNIRFDAECREQSPTANPQQHFLLEAQLRSATI